MGIKYLNKFLKENASDSINFYNLSEFSGKKIAIDISIYMYKFASDNTLIENIYLMLCTLRHYNIIPIFIFDGKPPIEKKELLKKRKQDKIEAEKQYLDIKKSLEINNIDESEKQEMLYNMDMLRRNFISISRNDIENVKNLIRAYGCTYFDAPGEADELCAMLTIREKVWACLSEDMDMFVYGCPRVIRYLSLLNHTAVLYETKGILSKLGITQKEMRQICVLSGTDYNINNENDHSLMNTLKLFKKYYKTKNLNKNYDFYNWLIDNYNNYIENYELLNRIYNIFDLSNNHCDIKIFEKIKIINSPINKELLIEILKEDGFIFNSN
jgi:5'-3' exonuclease